MKAVAEASRHGCDLVFPAGVYAFDQTLHVGVGGLRIFGRGKATLLYRGRGYAITVDAGERSIHYHHHLENLLIMGTGSADQHGLLVRNFVHGIRRSLRVTNIGGIAFDIAGDVLSTYEHCRVADNETARPSAFPAVDFRIRGTEAVTATTACLFINCMAERARDAGWLIEKADNCQWIGGTSEGIEGTGLRISNLSHGNVFESFFMEQNANGDVVDLGANTSFRNCTAMSRAKDSPYERIPSVIIGPGARESSYSGGSAYAILIDKGTRNSRVIHSEILYRIDDRGSGTVIQGCRQGYYSETLFPSQTFGNIENPDPLALDWYREASFLPVVAGTDRRGNLVLDIQDGASTRIGNLVFLSLTARISAVRTQPSGGLVVEGLPYPAGRTSALTVVVSGVDATGWKALTETGTGRLKIIDDTAGRLAMVDSTALKANIVITISGHYMV